MCRLRGQLPDIKKTLETIVHLKENKVSAGMHTLTYMCKDVLWQNTCTRIYVAVCKA